MTTPSTEAGRALLDIEWPHDSMGRREMAKAILAIEAEARAEADADLDRIVPPFVDTIGAVEAERDTLLAQNERLREALQQAVALLPADRVTLLDDDHAALLAQSSDTARPVESPVRTFDTADDAIRWLLKKHSRAELMEVLLAALASQPDTNALDRIRDEAVKP